MANIRGQHDAAEAHYRRSLAAYEALPDPHGSAIAHHNLGMLAADRGDFGQAAAHFDACERAGGGEPGRAPGGAVPAEPRRGAAGAGAERRGAAGRGVGGAGLQALGAHFDAADVHRVLALCDRAEGLLRQAEARLMQARELARMTGSRLTEAEAARELGRLYAETGRGRRRTRRCGRRRRRSRGWGRGGGGGDGAGVRTCCGRPGRGASSELPVQTSWSFLGLSLARLPSGGSQPYPYRRNS